MCLYLNEILALARVIGVLICFNIRFGLCFDNILCRIIAADFMNASLGLSILMDLHILSTLSLKQ